MPIEGKIEEDVVTNPKSFKSINFKLAGITPEQILNLRPTDEENARVEELVSRKKDQDLTPDEEAELDYYVEQEHVMSMAKLRALELIQSRGA